MKLPDFTQNVGMNRLRERMSAEFKTWTSDIVWEETSLEDTLSLYGEIEIPFEWLTVEEDKTLSFRGRKVLVYIRDHNEGGYEPKFHMASCSTIQEQVNNKRYDRYVASIKTDGHFKVNVKTSRRAVREEEWQLKVCKNCLEALNYNGYHKHHSNIQKDKAVASFSIEEFFQKYTHQSILQPKHTSATSPLDNYTNDWRKISTDYRKRRKYVCEHEQCGLNLEKYPKFLHVHHISGHKANNRDENLKALCLGCHAEEYLHEHLKKERQYEEFVKLFPGHWSQR